MYSEWSRFHPNWFTFGLVIAERVNTAKTQRRSNIQLKPSYEPNNKVIAARSNTILLQVQCIRIYVYNQCNERRVIHRDQTSNESPI